MDYYAVNDNIAATITGMTDRPYHHGHLRDALLAEAERTLREQGVEQLSLRDLARQAGVSHAAPRRHFADRQALLDALAGAGFARLALLPRMLRGNDKRPLETLLLDSWTSMPVLLSPTAFHRLMTPDGDSMTACSRETSAVRPSPLSISGRSPA